ncbi:uncharacterized protein K452DRAFT_288790 [Aplosporella prunicola CBS 121167]|uniref:Uncharacterized protein n=1 Tax=Aplosporella prunicola CBS 121167 TaxID=1176127 RepID=A0A6A6BDZ0_9PEZI|nr:uncharacterized protein K452DRAFT_288790 [Aplosporella prunicola CBS 121167]KAF2140701.1 hypothetical protein K452DRAFT_288790 [Aplosporella prunicola CBS 121167]
MPSRSATLILSAIQADLRSLRSTAQQQGIDLITLTNSVNNGSTTILSRLDDQDKLLKTTLFNLQSRQDNSRLQGNLNARVSPLQSLKTHQAIEGFPVRLRDINTMDHAQLNHLLWHLEYPRLMFNTLDQKRHGLRHALGIEASPADE